MTTFPGFKTLIVFFLYKNDLNVSCGSSNVTVFADDTALITAGQNTDFSMKEDVDAVSDWLVAIKFTINAD